MQANAFKAVKANILDIDYASQEAKSMIILPLYDCISRANHQ